MKIRKAEEFSPTQLKMETSLEVCPVFVTGGHPYGCTLDKGHEGPHMAHGADSNRPLFIWEEDE